MKPKAASASRGGAPRGAARVHTIFHGRVQGIGFRWRVQKLALERAASGWVRNRRDGTVELEAEGGEASLRALLEAVEKAFRSGIDGRDDRWIPPRGESTPFRILPTE
ncbi:MAG: acylphosphatase [Planctomycetes bacterium]|nr:acylphosphatase [Planctomycetota bacterium]